MDINKYKCCVCNQPFDHDFLLEAHLATAHLFYTPYECDYCRNALFPTDNSLREHYQQIHNLSSYNIKYKVTPELDKRREMLRNLMLKSATTPASIAVVAEPQLKAEQQQLDFCCHQTSCTSQLLQTCTAQLLQEQLVQTAEFIAQKNWEENGVIKRENMIKIHQPATEEANTLGGSSNEVAAAQIQLNNSILGASNLLFGIGRDALGDIDELDSSVASVSATNNNNKMPQKFADFTLIDGQQSVGTTKKRSRCKKMVDNNNDNAESGGNNYVMKDETTAKTNNSGGGGDADKTTTVVECADCKRKVGKYRNSMLIHTSTHHCAQPIFECLVEGCNKKWYSLSARTKEHIELYHGGNYALLKDNRPVLLAQLKTKTARLFPEFYTFGGKLLDISGGGGDGGGDGENME